MIVRDENDMLALGARLAEVVQPGDVIALRGGLGAGKTTLARGLLSALGLEEEAPSPSFAIVQPYDPPLVRFPVTHVDLYRLENAARSEEHTSELQSLMRISYAVFCLNNTITHTPDISITYI